MDPDSCDSKLQYIVFSSTTFQVLDLSSHSHMRPWLDHCNGLCWHIACHLSSVGSRCNDYRLEFLLSQRSLAGGIGGEGEGEGGAEGGVVGGGVGDGPPHHNPLQDCSQFNREE